MGVKFDKKDMTDLNKSLKTYIKYDKINKHLDEKDYYSMFLCCFILGIVFVIIISCAICEFF